MEKDIIINDINDYADYLGVEVSDLEKSIYNGTVCGAWINWTDKSMSIGSIVEGSDAEFSKTFYFPVKLDKIDSWFTQLEDLCDEAWHEANDYDEE